MPQTIVIIGANMVGAAAAITLRDEGFTGNVVLIGAEPHPMNGQPFPKNIYRTSSRWKSCWCDQQLTTINRGKDLRLAMRLIEAQFEVDPQALDDEAVKLRTLLPRG